MVIVVALSVSFIEISVSFELNPGGATIVPAQEPSMIMVINRVILSNPCFFIIAS